MNGFAQGEAIQKMMIVLNGGARQVTMQVTMQDGECA